MKIHANKFRVKCPDVCNLVSDEREGRRERERRRGRDSEREREVGRGIERANVAKY